MSALIMDEIKYQATMWTGTWSWDEMPSLETFHARFVNRRGFLLTESETKEVHAHVEAWFKSGELVDDDIPF